MADKIKGITVQIGGDTSKLSQALTKVNGSIKTTKTQLQEINKLLKLDPKNTDLLREKQRLLEQQIQKTKDKLSALQQAQEQAAQMLANGEIDQGAYDNLTQKVGKTEEELKKLEQQAKETEQALGTGFEQAAEKMQAAGEKIEEVGQKMKKLSALAAAGLGAAVKVTADFDKSMSKVAAVSGATGKELEDLRDKAREMGETTKFSASEAADAMNYMAMAGWKTEDMLSGIEGVMSLAAASGEDLATTADIVTDALTAFGLSAEDSGHFADVLAAASSNANTNVSMMGETFKYAAPIAGALGFSVEDVAEAIGLMANSGVKGSQAGTALRTIMQKLQGTLELTSASLGDIEIETANADGTMRDFGDILGDLRTAFDSMTESEKASAAETLVGKNAMSGFLAIMNAAPEDIEKLSKAIAGAEGTAAGMAEIMQDNLGGQLEILKSQLSELAISIGDTMMPTIREIVGKIQEFVDWLNSLDEETKTTIATVLAVTAALAPVLITIGKLITAISAIMTVLNPLTIAIGGVAAAMIYLGVTAENAYDDARTLNDAEQETVDTVNGLTESYNALAEARDAATQQANEQANKEQYLWSELQKVVDENGHVLEGCEERAAYLTGELSDALGIEIDLTDDQIKNYKDLAGSIETVIERKKANAILTANEAAYTEAITHQAEAYSAMRDAATEVRQEESRLSQAEKDLNDLVRERDEAVRQATESAITHKDAMLAEERITAEYEGAIWKANDAVNGHKDRLEELKGTLETSEETYANYSSTIQNYEELSEALISEDEAAISTAILKTAENFKTATTSNKEQLTAQRDALKKTYEDMQQAVDEGAPNITEKQVEEARLMYELSEEELKKLPPEYTGTVDAAAKGIKDETAAQKSSVQSSLAGMISMDETVKKGTTWGRDFVNNLVEGMNDKIPVLSKTVQGIAKLYKTNLGHSVPEEGPMKDELSWMPDFMENLATGIEQNKWRVLDEAQGLAADLKKTLNVQVQNGSMSAQINNRTTVELDGRVIADVVNKQLGALV